VVGAGEELGGGHHPDLGQEVARAHPGVEVEVPDERGPRHRGELGELGDRPTITGVMQYGVGHDPKSLVGQPGPQRPISQPLLGSGAQHHRQQDVAQR
jgi:hypothetical protein